MRNAIDSHVHVLEDGWWPSTYFDHVARLWALKKPGRTASQIRDDIEPGLIDPGAQRLSKECVGASVDVGVIVNIDWGLEMDPYLTLRVEDQLYRLAELVENSSGRLAAVAGLDPRRPNAGDILATAHRMGMRGLKLYPPMGFELDTPSIEPLVRYCAANGLPVIIHTGESLPATKTRLGHPLLAEELCLKFSEARFVLAHSGGRLWRDCAIELASKVPNAYLELSGLIPFSQRTANAWLPEAVGVVLNCISRVGSSRILFGSDYISGSRIQGPGALSGVWDRWDEACAVAAEEGVLGIEDVRRINHINASEMFALPGHDQ